MVRPRHIPTALALAIAVAGSAGAGLVPGGGNAASDCYTALDVVGIDNGTLNVERNKKVLCVDGEPCDQGPCGDGVCDFKVRLCWNHEDPNVAACVPPRRLDALLLRGALAAVLVMPDDLDGAACNEEYVDFAVATRANGRRPGRMTVRMSARAPEGTVPASDTDRIRLVCVPRARALESCPMPNTTTLPATSTTVTSTTTTSLRQTTTTRRRRTTTTTTRPATTTTVVVPTTTTFVFPTTTFVFPTTTTFVLPTTTTTFVFPTTTSLVLPTLPLPTTTVVATTTFPVVTTTPASSTTTTTRRRRGGGRGDDD